MLCVCLCVCTRVYLCVHAQSCLTLQPHGPACQAVCVCMRAYTVMSDFATPWTSLPGCVCSVCVCVHACIHTQSCLTLQPHGPACQAPLSMGFLRQGYWSGLPFSLPGDLPDPCLLHLLHWQVDSLPLAPPEKPGIPTRELLKQAKCVTHGSWFYTQRTVWEHSRVMVGKERENAPMQA